jgi:hypothetical protein
MASGMDSGDNLWLPAALAAFERTDGAMPGELSEERTDLVLNVAIPIAKSATMTTLKLHLIRLAFLLMFLCSCSCSAFFKGACERVATGQAPNPPLQVSSALRVRVSKL